MKWKTVGGTIPASDAEILLAHLPAGMTVHQFNGKLLRVLVENPKRIGTMLELIQRREKVVEVEREEISKEEYRLD
jgi:hypothetical protein